MLPRVLAVSALLLATLASASPVALAGCTSTSSSTPVGPLSVDESDASCNYTGSGNHMEQTRVVENMTTGWALVMVNSSGYNTSYGYPGYSNECDAEQGAAGTGVTGTGVSTSTAYCGYGYESYGTGNGNFAWNDATTLRDGTTGLAVGYEESRSVGWAYTGNWSSATDTSGRAITVQDTRGNAIPALRVGVRHTESWSTTTECRETYTVFVQGPVYQEAGPGSFRCQPGWGALPEVSQTLVGAYALLS